MCGILGAVNYSVKDSLNEYLIEEFSFCRGIDPKLITVPGTLNNGVIKEPFL